MSCTPLLSTQKRSSVKRVISTAFESELQQPIPKRLQYDVPILGWLNDIPRPPSTTAEGISRPKSLPADYKQCDIHCSSTTETFTGSRQWPFGGANMRGHNHPGKHARQDGCAADSQSESVRSMTSASTASTKVKPSSSKYRNVLEYNNIVIDSTGTKISEAVRDMLDTDILKTRTSPPLSQDVLKSTMMSMNQWGNSTENVVNSFTSSAMFPYKQDGVGLGGNTPWPRAALPQNPDYIHSVSGPKPDYHVGYSTGVKSGFSAREASVIDHEAVQPYTQPGTGNIMPFLTVELKSEATGGTLYHAENQAAGSGTYCVRAMEWLLDQGNEPAQNVSETDTISFSMSVTGRLVVLSAHWRSIEDRAYFMSHVDTFLTTKTEHIQACHSTVKNIIDWAIGKRHPELKKTLQALFPLPHQWTQRPDASSDGPVIDEDQEQDENAREPVSNERSYNDRSLRSKRAKNSGLMERSSGIRRFLSRNTESLEESCRSRSASTRDLSMTDRSKTSKETS